MTVMGTLQGIPLYSIFTLFTEAIITVGIFYCFYIAYTQNRFLKKFVAVILAYEIFFNISYMASRLMTHIDPSDHVDSPFHIAIAIFHGTFALLMFIALLVFMYFAWKGYDRGENYFVIHKKLLWTFIAAWMVAILSGFLFFYEAYFSPEELHHRALLSQNLTDPS